MPRESQRAKDLNFFYKLREILSDEWIENSAFGFVEDDLLNEDIEEVTAVIEAIEENRYYSRSKILKNPSFRENFINYDEKNLRQILRMDLSSFYMILDKIKFNPVFLNSSNNPQRPVFEQLSVSLEILGSYGNSSSLLKFSRLWAIGEGTASLYLKRVLQALLDLKSEYVRWPNTQERIFSSDNFGDNYGFDGCVGLIDGTDIAFEKKPMLHGELYFSRKKNTALMFHW
jgi:hypothetical protein